MFLIVVTRFQYQSMLYMYVEMLIFLCSKRHSSRQFLKGSRCWRLQMSCQPPTEFPYYFSAVESVDVFAHCTLPAENLQRCWRSTRLHLHFVHSVSYRARKFQTKIQWNNVNMYFLSVIVMDFYYIKHFISSQKTDFSYTWEFLPE